MTITKSTVGLLLLLGLAGCKQVNSTVTVSYEGAGRITEGSKIDCGSQCTAQYPVTVSVAGNFIRDYDITLTATPDAGQELFTWVNSCGKSLTCPQPVSVYCAPTPQYTCTGFGGITYTQHAVFVPAGSVAQEYRYGTDQNCLVDTGGTLKCWGPEGFGGSSVPAVPDPVEVKLATRVGCARSGSDHKLYCWGNDTLSQVPAMTNPGPFVVLNGYNAGARYACALDQGQLVCWGEVPLGVITRKPVLQNPVALWGVDSNICVQDDNGEHCWGQSLVGQSKPPALNQPAAIVAWDNKTCALTTEGLRCWGAHAGGNSLDGSFVNAATLDLKSGACIGDDNGMHCYKNTFAPLALPPALQDSRRAQSMGYQVCGQDDTGLDCWNWLTNSDASQRVVDGAVTDFDVLDDGACALSGRTLSCWGDSEFWPAQDSATRTLTLQQPQVVSINNQNWCVGGADGLQCRHKNSNSILATRKPTGLVGITAIKLTTNNACALHAGGVTCWGSNAFGVLDVPALQNPRQIALGDAHACALEDRGVICWGEKLLRPVE